MALRGNAIKKFKCVAATLTRWTRSFAWWRCGWRWGNIPEGRCAKSVNFLEKLIREEIGENGPIPFARFMELALYHPEWGYYAREKVQVGRHGDFFTSVSVGPLFGKLLATQFVDWWREMGKPSPFHLIECGGLDGTLACDVLREIQKSHPEFSKAIRYILVEPLSRLKERQREKLRVFSNIAWADSIKDLLPSSGILFGNELLDAFPVHRLEWKEGWKETLVGLENGNFGWIAHPCPESWTAFLPKNFHGTFEYNPGAMTWLREASAALHKGRVLLLDYGWTDEEYFQVARPAGALRAYRNHRLEEDLFSEPGEKDLTAHVRWTPLLEEAKNLNFHLEDFIQQGRWLSRIVVENHLDLGGSEIRQFQTLTHPEMMGSPFRALVLTR